MGGSGSGSAELRPDGTARISGSIASIGTRAMVGEVTVQGEPGRYVRVSLPPAIILYGYSGGSLRVDSIETSVNDLARLDSEGRLTFRFGGVIRVDGDVDGEFRGDLPIDVDYQ